MITVANRTMSNFTFLGTNVVAFQTAQFDEWQLWESPADLQQLVTMIEQGKAHALLGNNVTLDVEGVKALGNPVMRHLLPHSLTARATVSDLRGLNPDGRIPNGCTVKVDETCCEYTYVSGMAPETIQDDEYFYIVPAIGTGYWRRTPGSNGGATQTFSLNASAAATARTVKVVTVVEDKVKMLEVEIIAQSADGEVGHFVSHLLFRNVGAGVELVDHKKLVEQKSDAGWTGIAASLVDDEATVTFLGSAVEETMSRGSWRELVLEV